MPSAAPLPHAAEKSSVTPSCRVTSDVNIRRRPDDDLCGEMCQGVPSMRMHTQ